MQFKITILFLVFCASNYQAKAQNKMRPVEELSADTTGWILTRQLINTARNPVEVLNTSVDGAKQALFQTQVTTHSILGAIIYNTGGLLIANGWLRILGSGNVKLRRSLPQWNKGKSFREFGDRPQFLLIADDAAGGFFAVNGGTLGPNLGNIYYLSPDNVANWEDLKMGYSDFINFCLNSDLDKFYSNVRWNTWKVDLTKITGDQGFMFYPYLFSKEGKRVNKTKISITPIQELYDFVMDTRRQLFSK